MFKIGEFSRLTRVSPRMLRHYEKCGLLYPAHIDPFTGYRQYSARQIPLLASIVMLRDLGFSIDEIGDALPHMDDAEALDRILKARAAEIRSVIDAQQDRLARLTRLREALRKERPIMVHAVELKSLPAIPVLSLRENIPHYNQEGMLWEKLGAYVGEHAIPVTDGGGFSIYHDDEHKESDVDVEIAVPVRAFGENRGNFTYRELEAVPTAAVARFSGPYDGGYEEAISALAGWIEENGYAFCGDLRGHAIVTAMNEPDPQKWLTELQVPVTKRA